MQVDTLVETFEKMVKRGGTLSMDLMFQRGLPLPSVQGAFELLQPVGPVQPPPPGGPQGRPQAKEEQETGLIRLRH